MHIWSLKMYYPLLSIAAYFLIGLLLALIADRKKLIAYFDSEDALMHVLFWPILLFYHIIRINLLSEFWYYLTQKNKN